MRPLTCLSCLAQVIEAADGSQYWCVQHWGRTGTKGQTKVEAGLSRDEAIAQFEAKFEEKAGILVRVQCQQRKRRFIFSMPLLPICFLLDPITCTPTSYLFPHPSHNMYPYFLFVPSSIP